MTAAVENEASKSYIFIYFLMCRPWGIRHKRKFQEKNSFFCIFTVILCIISRNFTRKRHESHAKSGSRNGGNFGYALFLLPHDPFTVKIRAIVVQTKRSQKNAFGAALHKIPFDRVNGDK
jgi:hypothetical protein